jgi:hypothetical protein
MVMVRAHHHCHFWYFLPTQCYITTNLCKLTTYLIPKEIYNAILIAIATCSRTWSFTDRPGLYLWYQASAHICGTYQQQSKPFTLLHFQCFLCFVAIPYPSKKNSVIRTRSVGIQITRLLCYSTLPCLVSFKTPYFCTAPSVMCEPHAYFVERWYLPWDALHLQPQNPLLGITIIQRINTQTTSQNQNENSGSTHVPISLWCLPLSRKPQPVGKVGWITGVDWNQGPPRIAFSTSSLLSA